MGTQILNPKKSLTPIQKRLLKKLESDSLDFVESWMVNRENYTPEEARRCKQSFLMTFSLRFLSNDDVFNKQPLVLSEEGDQFWHTFLLFNSTYNTWCQKHFGQVINHFPGAATSDSWIATQTLIHETYGEEWQKSGTSLASILSEFGLREW